MDKPRQRMHMWLIGLMGVVFLLHSGVVRADARTDYLINLLKTGGSYRVKVQAAQALGRIQCKEAVPELINALKDKSDEVVIAASAALAEIGDPSALKTVEKAKKKASSAAVKTQLASTLRILKKAGPAENAEAAGGTASVAYMVKVDAMGNSSASTRADITDVLKRIVTESLEARGTVTIQAEGLNQKQVKKKLKSEKLKGFIVSGSLIKLHVDQNFIVVNITLNVFSNPEYNLVMMPSGEIRVPAGISASTPDQKKGVEEKAIRRLVDNLIGKILEAAPDVL